MKASRVPNVTDPFSLSDEGSDDTFRSPKITEAKPTVSGKNPVSTVMESDGDNNDELFSAKSMTKKQASVVSGRDDPLSSVDQPSAAQNGTKVERTEKKDPFNDSDDDLFTKLPDSNVNGRIATTKEEQSVKNPSTVPSREPPPSFKKESPSLFSKSESSISGKPAELESRESPTMIKRESPSPLRESPPLLGESPPPLPKDSSPLQTAADEKSGGFTLDDSDDDIFSARPSRKSAKNATDLFMDDDDLFGDLKPKSKKSVLVSSPQICIHV